MSKKKRKRKLSKRIFGEGAYGTLYAYVKTGKTIREKLGTKHGCNGEYRVKEVKKGVKVLLCIRKTPGKRGGKTKAIALLRDVSRVKQYKKHYEKKEPVVVKVLEKIEKLKERFKKKKEKKTE